MTTILPFKRRTPEHLTELGAYVTLEESLTPERNWKMNRVQIEGMIRDVIKAGGAYFVAAGAISSSSLEIFVGVAVFAGGSIWSWYSNRILSMVSSVADSDTVKRVVMTDPADGRADPNPKVT